MALPNDRKEAIPIPGGVSEDDDPLLDHAVAGPEGLRRLRSLDRLMGLRRELGQDKPLGEEEGKEGACGRVPRGEPNIFFVVTSGQPSTSSSNRRRIGSASSSA